MTSAFGGGGKQTTTKQTTMKTIAVTVLDTSRTPTLGEEKTCFLPSVGTKHYKLFK